MSPVTVERVFKHFTMSKNQAVYWPCPSLFSRAQDFSLSTISWSPVWVEQERLRRVMVRRLRKKGKVTLPGWNQKRITQQFPVPQNQVVHWPCDSLISRVQRFFSSSGSINVSAQYLRIGDRNWGSGDSSSSRQEAASVLLFYTFEGNCPAVSATRFLSIKFTIAFWVHCSEFTMKFSTMASLELLRTGRTLPVLLYRFQDASLMVNSQLWLAESLQLDCDVFYRVNWNQIVIRKWVKNPFLSYFCSSISRYRNHPRSCTHNISSKPQV